MTSEARAVPPSVPRPLLRVTRRSNGDGPSVAILGGTALPRSVRTRAHLTLGLLAGFRALRFAQLQTFLFAEHPFTEESRRVVTQRVLRTLRDRGLAATMIVPDTSGAMVSRAYVLTGAGRRLYAASEKAYPARRLRAPGTALVAHALLLGDIALALRAHALGLGDLDLIWEADWAAVARLGANGVIPDAFVTLERGGWRVRAFIEADRSTEHDAAFTRKILRYIRLYLADDWRARLRTWPLVLTVTTSEERAQRLAELAHATVRAESVTRIAQGFRCTSLEQLQRDGPLAPIWHVAGSAERWPLCELLDENDGYSEAAAGRATGDRGMRDDRTLTCGQSRGPEERVPTCAPLQVQEWDVATR